MVSYRAERDNVSPEELENTYRQQGAATICDLETSIKQDKIVFADGATILFGGCNAGRDQNDGSPGIAEVTAQELSIKTIGANGSTGDGGKSKVSGDTDNADPKCSIRSTRVSALEWNLFTPQGDGSVSNTPSGNVNQPNRQNMDVSGCTLR